MKIDIGWLFTAILFGIFLGKWFEDFIPVLWSVIFTAHITYTLCMISKEID